MTETITAQLNHIRFQNDSGFVIGMAVISGDTLGFKGEFGILGNLLNPVEGMAYKLSGEWSSHPEFGKQFKFSNYSPVAPKDTNGIYKYLVRTAKWIGPSIASALVDIYGDKTLDVLREDPEMVAAEIRGITEKRAKEIQAILVEHEEEESVLVELMGILNIPGLRRSLPVELIQEFGSNAAKILKKNPYVITQFYGTGFLIADRLAMHSLKIDPKSMFRIRAAIEYAMKQDLHGTGSTWINPAGLIAAMRELIGDVDDFELLGIEELLAREVIVEGPAGLAFWEVDKDESYIADVLKVMVG